MRFLCQFLVTLLVLAAAPVAHAGDVANLEILGFSKDGKIFAFEEYGIQDGSGFPYANRYYINTSDNSFLPGTPVRVRLEQDGSPVSEARQKAREQGEKTVPASELSANRGYTAGLNPITELSANPLRIKVNPRPVFPTIDAPLEFVIEEIPIKAAEICGSQGDTKGFRLSRIADGKTMVLLEDKSIPKSRGCPMGYALGGVQTFSTDALTAYAVLISVRQFGFEGPDHRWIAVTGRP